MRGRIRAATCAWLLLACWPAWALAAVAGANLPDFTELVKANSPAVVNISTTRAPRTEESGGGRQGMPKLPEDHPFRDFFDRFLGEEDDGPRWPSIPNESLGSGFIISDDGYILTNHHVVSNASEIIVRLSDRREFTAELVGVDRRSDLALLDIDAESLPVAAIGSSSELEVGEWVLAIGSPFGFEHSVTAGIVSATGRSLPRENYVPFIQTDVAINPGNSGGPLFNLDGEVVGINSHIYSRTGGFMGVSFAIPVELAMNVADQLKSGGSVSRGWLGVLIQDVTRELAASFGMSHPQGALVAQVIDDSPAADAGLRVGDVIVRFNGREVPTSGALPPMVGRTGVGETVPVEVIRDGERETLEIRIGELPEEPRTLAAPDGRIEKLGLAAEPLDEAAREALELGDEIAGVVVTEVEPGPARDAGVKPGDVISRLDRKPVTGVADLRRIVAELDGGRSVPVLVRRGDGPRFLALRIP
ncbi:DegQ family serine endoprotease [Arhodomonas sp. AD133]|uniref:DegQ family serine endoprotease n=1 Tax=Arhodomonas sp. AD133 TaxID=3415009 RepID=UPI003EB7071A